MLKGWLRRRYYWYFKRDEVRRYQKLRRGECKHCGACCTLCPFLDAANHRCRIYAIRPDICRAYMMTPEDKVENPGCGYYFEKQ